MSGHRRRARNRQEGSIGTGPTPLDAERLGHGVRIRVPGGCFGRLGGGYMLCTSGRAEQRARRVRACTRISYRRGVRCGAWCWSTLMTAAWTRTDTVHRVRVYMGPPACCYRPTEHGLGRGWPCGLIIYTGYIGAHKLRGGAAKGSDAKEGTFVAQRCFSRRWHNKRCYCWGAADGRHHSFLCHRSETARNSIMATAL